MEGDGRVLIIWFELVWDIELTSSLGLTWSDNIYWDHRTVWPCLRFPLLVSCVHLRFPHWRPLQEQAELREVFMKLDANSHSDQFLQGEYGFETSSIVEHRWAVVRCSYAVLLRFFLCTYVYIKFTLSFHGHAAGCSFSPRRWLFELSGDQARLSNQFKPSKDGGTCQYNIV